MTRATIAKLSICDCGFPLLKETASIGDEYKLNLDRRAGGTLICGGCRKKTRQLECVFVYGPDGGMTGSGFLPIEIFKVDVSGN